MYNHAPKNYKCPICLAINDIENKDTMICQEDIFYRDDFVMALINSKFVKKNSGHVIVVPIKHYENIYELPDNEAKRIIQVAKKISIALKKIRNCNGVMMLQNNEPASDQHAFHYHLHIFPRFDGDQIHKNMLNTRISTPEERKPYADKLRKYFKDE
jgi:histidine triad (HIT) family protein